MSEHTTSAEKAVESGPLSVFVSGAATSAGMALCRYLVAAGCRVTGVVDGTASGAALRALGVLPVYGDPARAGEMRSVMQMAQAEVVVHAAPQVINDVPELREKWEAYLPVLTEQTPALLQAAKDAGAKYFMHLSYAYLYGDQGDHPVDETATPLSPGDYDAAEALFAAALQAEQTVLKGDLPGCVLRVGFIYGAEVAGLLALREALMRGRVAMDAARGGVANWIYADDLGQAVLLAAKTQIPGKIFNIVDDVPGSANDFMAEFAHSLGIQKPPRLPGFLPLPGRSSGGPAQKAVLRFSTRASNNKAKNSLGWKPRYADRSAGFDAIQRIWRAGSLPQPAVEAQPAVDTLATMPGE